MYRWLLICSAGSILSEYNLQAGRYGIPVDVIDLTEDGQVYGIIDVELS